MSGVACDGGMESFEEQSKEFSEERKSIIRETEEE